MLDIPAESAYVFRHALVRDAAYQLQLPSDRAQLHALAFELIERAFGGRAPAPMRRAGSTGMTPPHPTDVAALELAEHAHNAAGTDFSDLHRLYLHRAALHATRHYHNEVAMRCWRQLGELVSGRDKIDALSHVGKLAGPMGRANEAQEAFTAALEIARELNDHELESLLLNDLGTVYRDTGRREEAALAFEQALAINRDAGLKNAEGHTLVCIASLHHIAHEYNDAHKLVSRALQLFRETGDKRKEASALDMTGLVCVETGRPEQAETSFKQGMAIQQEVGDRFGEGITQGNLAFLYYRTGRLEEAHEGFRAALAIHKQVGNRRFEGMTWCDDALCLLALNRPDEAREAWDNGVAILTEAGDLIILSCSTRDMHEACQRAGIPPFKAPPVPPPDH
jgi:tetratricopeptide (TPR) repeat protein